MLLDMDGQPRRGPKDVGADEFSDGAMGLELLKIETASIPVQEAIALRAEDVGHLHGRSRHGCLLR